MTSTTDESVTLAQMLQADGLPGVFVSAQRPWCESADETLAPLNRSGTRISVRHGELVRMTRTQEGAPTTETITETALKGILARRMNARDLFRQALIRVPFWAYRLSRRRDPLAEMKTNGSRSCHKDRRGVYRMVGSSPNQETIERVDALPTSLPFSIHPTSKLFLSSEMPGMVNAGQGPDVMVPMTVFDEQKEDTHA